jgi:type VI protein secretion system component Hcp
MCHYRPSAGTSRSALRIPIFYSRLVHEVHMTRISIVAACLAVLLACAAIPANANTTIEMTLAGIGTDISVDSFSYSVTGNYAHAGSGWQVQSPAASDFSITRNVDSFSPTLQLAAAHGKDIPSGDLDFFLSSFSPTVPYLDYHFTDGFLTSYHLSGGGDPLPQETFSFTFEHVTLTYAADRGNPWGAVLPLASQVQEGPFTLNFAYDLAFDASTFGDSTILMDATIPGQRPPVPEPASIVLFSSGLMCIAEVLRRKRIGACLSA